MNIFILFFIACEDPKTEETATDPAAIVCDAWQDSCSDCSWMCTPQEETPTNICDQDCSGVAAPVGECVLGSDDTCSFSE